ncbi:MAG: ADP-ribosylglycohydrolase family protein [Anaerolineae bacterium]
MANTNIDRLRAIAVGAAVGDALGMALEFGPRQPPDNLVRDMQPGRLPTGRFTDDTEMALALAESLLTQSPLDPADLAARFVDWPSHDPPDVGVHTRRVLAGIDEETPWDISVERVQAQHPDSAGNGSLMRTWPLAIRYANDLDNLLIDSWRQSRVTHPHRDCLAACAFVNVAIHQMQRGPDPGTALILASTLVRMDDELWHVVETAPYRQREELANTGWVRHTLESVVWALTTTDSFEEAVVQAVNLGGDAETSGSVAGAMAGAYYGLSGIPQRWQDALRGEWPLGSGRIWQVNDFIALADRLSDS